MSYVIVMGTFKPTEYDQKSKILTTLCCCFLIISHIKFLFD